MSQEHCQHRLDDMLLGYQLCTSGLQGTAVAVVACAAHLVHAAGREQLAQHLHLLFLQCVAAPSGKLK